jgi:lipopolysaccharide export system protein LptA
MVAGVAVTYIVRRQVQAGREPSKPSAIPPNLNATAPEGWHWAKNIGSHTVVEIRAQAFEQARASSEVKLKGVELKLYDESRKNFDLVKSASATVDFSAGIMSSEGEVEIVMGIPVESARAARLLSIKSSGVNFDIHSGKAETERAASFTFDRGSGQAVGAMYDPSLRELFLKSEVKLEWSGKVPMKVESGELSYRETDSHVFLSPWARFTRGTLTMDSGPASVVLEEGIIRKVDAANASGVDRYPKRQVRFGARELHMDLDENGIVQKITGSNEANLLSESATARTTVKAARVDMDFSTANEESVLQKAFATGGASVQSDPIPRPNVLTADTRILRSEVIEVQMRPGGEEIEKMLTHTPGEIEFVPNRKGPRRRWMNAERMTVEYGPQNQVRYFRAVVVKTRTENGPVTTSKDLAAEFDPNTGDLVKLEQWENFRYEEGPRRATANHASMQGAAMTLTGAARVWDATGSTQADTIKLDEKTGDFDAQGNVASTRQPDKKAKSGAMLSGEEALQARAARMSARDKNQLIVYEGSATLWQGADRLQADRIEINRTARTLTAKGQVVSQIMEAEKGTPIIVRAPELHYREDQQVAHYKGGAVLVRENMNVKGREIRAFLKTDEKGNSGVDRALAEGAVDILERENGRSRHGTGERAEYYLAEEKVILEGGEARFEDSQRGSTRGRKLTYYAKNDRLLVDGADRQPVESIIRKR